jgi:hypothetical protein
MSQTKLLPATRRLVLDLAQHKSDPRRYQCAGCRKYFSISAVNIDHIIPESESTPEQRTDPDNLQVLCNPKGSTRLTSCHKKKTAREAADRARRNRVPHRWTPSLVYGSGSMILGGYTWQSVFQHDEATAREWALWSGLSIGATFGTYLVQKGAARRRPRKTISPVSQDEPGGLDVARIVMAVREAVGPKGDVRILNVQGMNAFTVSYIGTGFPDHESDKRFDLLNKIQAKIGDRWIADWDTQNDRASFTRRPAMPKIVHHPGLEEGRPWYVLPIADGVSFNLMDTSHLLIIGETNSGKALALDTPVPTPKGWATMGELVQGQEVFDEDGKACRVVYAHQVRYGRPCYEVVFSDGATIVADADHNWLTSTTASRMYDRPPQVRTTEEVRATLVGRKDGARNHAIPIAGPLDYPAQELPLDPYLFGTWLADGGSTKASFTTGGQDLAFMIEEIGKVARITSVRKDPRSDAHDVRFAVSVTRDGVESRLRRLGVWGNKHIPEAYLRGSIEQRKALLAGLFDGDGNVALGTVEYTSTSEKLARGVLELSRGLGFKATMRTKRCKGRTEASSTAYRICFTAHEAVFRNPRKLDRQGIAVSDGKSRRRSIVAVNPVESVPVRCITVDSASSLYLAGEACVPTHNTSILRSIIAAASDSASRKEVRLILSDPKRVEMVGFRGWPGVKSIVTKPRDLWDVAFMIQREMDRRYTAFEERGIPLDSHEKWICVFDEFKAYYDRVFDVWTSGEKDDDDNPLKRPGEKVPGAIRALADVIAMARKCGIHIIISTQSPDSQMFGTSGVRQNLPGRATVGAIDGIRALMIYGDSGVGRDVPSKAKGRATVQIGDGTPVECQAYWLPCPADADPNYTNTEEDWTTLLRLGMPTCLLPDNFKELVTS